MDSNKSGEARGGHVRKDLKYIENAAFLKKKAGSEILVKYTVDAKAAAVFEATPFQTKAGPDIDSSVFNKARKAGIWYKKQEGKLDTQGTYGFPGSATTIFNSALVKKPEIIRQ